MKHEKILVVEDNPITRKMLRVALQTAGYHVMEAPDGRTAMGLVEHERPDLVLQDLKLPDMDGCGLARALRMCLDSESLPILALSGHATRLEEAKTSRVGFTDFIQKPIEPSQLLQIVAAYLRESRNSPGGPGKGKQILLVEDNPVQRKLLRLILENLGFRVAVAADGQEGLALARRNPPDAVVADILMPKMDGFNLCLSMKEDERFLQVPVVLISSVFTSEEDHRLAQVVGASKFIVRNGDHDSVTKALLEVLDQTSSSRPVTPKTFSREEEIQNLAQQVERITEVNIRQTSRLSMLEAGVGVLTGLSEIITDASTEKALAEDLLPRCLDASGLAAGALFLARKDDKFDLVAEQGFSEGSLGLPPASSIGEAVLRKVSSERRVVTSPGEGESEGVIGAAFSRAGECSIALAPLVAQKDCLGVLVLVSPSKMPEREWVAFAEALGLQLGQILGITRAVSHAKKSEWNLARAQSMARLGSWEANQITGDLYWSDETFRILGLEPGKSNPSNEAFLNAVHPDDRDRVRSIMGEKLGKGQSSRYMHRILRPDGSIRIVEELSETILDPSGTPITLAGTIQDVTDRVLSEERLRSSEDQLRQAQKIESVGRLAGGIAHDFNNLLTVINGYSDLILARLESSDEDRADLQEVRNAGERAAALTRQLLAFSRKQILQPRVFDLNGVVVNLEKLLRRIIGEDIEFVTVLERNLYPVKADIGQIEQVIMNLVVNARDAMPEGGKLTLNSSNITLDESYAMTHISAVPGDYVMLAVSDTGIGMTAEVQAHLFEPFFTTKGPGKGTGLGLATVYGIVKQSGGWIWVYSEPGQGTCFKIYLPRAQELPEQSRPRVGKLPNASKGEMLLIVEDEEPVRRLAVHVLRNAGYTVLEARDGNEALKLTQEPENRIDLILSDMVMPGMSGPELARQVKATRPRIKIVFASGYTDTSIVKGGILAADMPFLQKPYSPEAMVHKVREVLDSATG